MAQMLKLFEGLSKFYLKDVTREQVEDLFEKFENPEANNGASSSRQIDSSSDEDNDNSEDDSSDSSNNSNGNELKRNEIVSFHKIPIVRQATRDGQVLSILQELSSAIRELREASSGYDNTYDCWDRVISVSPKDQYLTFVYTLSRLAKVNSTSAMYRKLTMACARTYILSLTIPGAKGFHIFDDKMIEDAIEVFHLIDAGRDLHMSAKELTEVWVNLVNFCDDLKIMFRYVHFAEYKDIRNAIIWELNKLLYNNHVNGYSNSFAAVLQTNCFEIFDEIVNAHNGDPKDTFMKIMKITYCLHVFPPKPKRQKAFNTPTDSTQFNEHISDWFVTIINKTPRVVTEVLRHFIEFVVTNPLKGEKDEKTQILDYVAKYDAALYTKCNESTLDFLLKAANADDINIRTNAVEILNRILLIEAKVNWEMFRHEISNVPREVYAIKELFNRLVDVNNGIKLKAINGMQQAYLKGTPDAVRIMNEGLEFAVFDEAGVSLPEEPRIRFREIRYERPQPIEPNYTFEGHEQVSEHFSRLPNVLYYLSKNNTAHVRRGSLVLLETTVLKNPLVIYRTKFVQETSKLGEDASLEVRKQSLQMIDSILNHYPNCYPIIYVWSQIIVPLFKDSDAKLVDQAWECFKRRVFDNIRGIDSSNQAEHFMPWVILRVLLSTQPRPFLQSCILESINRKLLDHKVLTLIESHTLTSNSTEAWIMLCFVAGKMKCKDADSLISSFIKSTLEQSWNAGQNLQIILEVLVIWINEFSHSALNMAFSCMVNLLKNGSIPPSLISKTFNLCMTIAAKSESNQNSSGKPATKGKGRSKAQLKWMKDIHATAEQNLRENLNEFNENRTVLLSYLFSYSEVNLELFIRPNTTIVHFIHKYLEEYIETPDTDLYPDDAAVLNQMIVLAGRFSIRDTNTASITCMLYRLILRKTERPTTVSNIIVCITDLCKKHTQVVELALSEIIPKLRSPYLEIRLITFKNLTQMILQDLVKLRGNLLLSLMAVLLDKNRELSNRATEFFMTYLEQKNSMLFQTCLLECPFVYNGYMDFEGFESFSPAEMQIESPLKGDENVPLRQLLYKAFMSEQEETVLLMFFENLKLIYAKIVKDPSINTREGYSMIKDMLFIMKEICDQTSPKNDSKAASQNGNDETNDLEDDLPPSMTATTSKTDSQSKEMSRKKKSIPTMNQALSTIEKMICLIPKIADHILDWDRSFQKSIEDLAVAVCQRFENLTEFAQPQTFWATYKKKSKQLITPSKRKGRTAARRTNETESESDDEDVEKRLRIDDNNEETSPSDKPMTLLFKPLLL